MKRTPLWLVGAGCVALLSGALVHAQPYSIQHISIECTVLNAEMVVVGRVVGSRKDAKTLTATLAVEETLRGEHHERQTCLLNFYEQRLAHWLDESSRLLITMSGDPAIANSIIELDAPKLEIHRADLTVLRKPTAVLEAARETIHRAPGVQRVQTFPLSLNTAGLYGHAHGGRVFVHVPVDAALEKRALAYLRADDWRKREEGARALGHFKTPENIARLQALLKDAGSAVTKDAANHRGVETRYYTVRSAAFDALTHWGVKTVKPVLEFESEKLDAVHSVYFGAIAVTPAAIRELDRFPNLDDLRLENARLTTEGLQELRRLKLRQLAFNETLDSDALLKPVGQLKGLRSLVLGGARITDKGLKEVARLEDLEYLYLAGTKITDAGLKELAGLKNLVTLHLNNTHVTNAGLKELAGLRKLTTLGLPHDRITDRTLRRLGAMNMLHCLEAASARGEVPTYANPLRAGSQDGVFALTLRGVPVTDTGLKELAALKNLEELTLSDIPMTDAGLKELAALKKLTKLSLWLTPTSDIGLRELAGFENLQELTLGRTQVTDAGLKELTVLKSLRSLDLVATRITDAGLTELTQLAHLKTLWIPQTKVTDVGLKTLATMTSLEDLHVGNNAITDAGLQNLASLKNLRVLGVGDTAVTGKGVARLRKALPKCEIIR